jgi:hypothetical protein
MSAGPIPASRFNVRSGLVSFGLVVAISGCAAGTAQTPAGNTATPAAASTTPEPTTDPDATPSPADPCDVGDFQRLPIGATCWADPDNDPSTPLRVLYTIPAAGWLAWPTKFDDEGRHIGIGINEITNLTVDACKDHRAADPPVGPTVDDLATALASLPPFQVTSAPADVTIYGFSGKHLELTVPDLRWVMRGREGYFPACKDGVLRTWMAPHLSYAFYGYRPQQIEQFWILDVEGTRLVIEANWSPELPPEWIEEMRAILDSIQIEP